MSDDRLRQLLTAHADSLARYFRRRVERGAVDDLVAEVFGVAWRRLPDIPDGDQTLPWLYGVARNVLAHHQRTTRRRQRLRSKVISTDASLHTVDDPADEVAAKDLVTRAARRLSPAETELLELISWERLTTAELAETLGCSLNAVHIRIHRLRTNLRTYLDDLETLTDSQEEATR